MQKEILSLFGRVLPVKVTTSIFTNMNEFATKHGYLVHPEACDEAVIFWINNQHISFNATFYKRWQDIISKTRLELLIDQLAHYASTYGTDYEGTPYIPDGRDVSDVSDVPGLTGFKVILPITHEELTEKVQTMIYSGIALKEETIKSLVKIITDAKIPVEVSLVKNREAKMYLCKNLKLTPDTPEEMVRFLLFLTTGNTMVIKNKKTIEAVHNSYIDVSMIMISFGLERLAEVFYRYKQLFLAMRSNVGNRIVVNQLRRLAKKFHKPYVPGYFENILSVGGVSPTFLQRKLDGLSNFKKVSLLQTILVRGKMLSLRPFGIRNQKLFIKETKSPVSYPPYYNDVYITVYDSLISSLNKKAREIALPAYNVTLPTSEKSFIGNLPLGTSFNIGKSDAIIGIYWKGEDGAQDLDLKYIDIDGGQVGWNTSYYSHAKDVIFSGDMTSANPEATELIYAHAGFVPGIIKVNLYNGEIGSKFRMFFAIEKCVNLRHNYMVDPNNVLFSVDMAMASQEQTLGIIENGVFYLAAFRTGRGRVAGESVTNKYIEYVLNTRDCYLDMRKVLTEAGYTISLADSATPPDKSTFIELLS